MAKALRGTKTRKTLKYELKKNHLYDSSHDGSLRSESVPFSMEGRRAVDCGGDMTSGRESVRREWNETLWERLDISSKLVKEKEKQC